eukprot:6199728-Pleurochrysis_carterae.AAC.2
MPPILTNGQTPLAGSDEGGGSGQGKRGRRGRGVTRGWRAGDRAEVQKFDLSDGRVGGPLCAPTGAWQASPAARRDSGVQHRSTHATVLDAIECAAHSLALGYDQRGGHLRPLGREAQPNNAERAA